MDKYNTILCNFIHASNNMILQQDVLGIKVFRQSRGMMTLIQLLDNLCFKLAILAFKHMHNYYLLSYILLMVLLDSSVKSDHLFEQHLLESVLVLALVYLKDVWHFHSCPVSLRRTIHILISLV